MLVVFSGRAARASFQFNALNIQFNGNSSAVYSYVYLRGDGASGSSNAQSGQSWIELGNVNELAGATTVHSSINAYIPNYTAAVNKSVSADAVSENNATTSYQTISSGLYANTSAITSLKLLMASGNIAQYSTASLYTIIKGSGGASVA